jgi:hypothetical protein
MAGTVIADKVQAQSTSTLEIMNGVALTPPLIEDVNGVQIGTFCRAWVNFNGTGTVAIRASFNVSSIFDNGTGIYTVNFTNAMPDANYSVNVTCGGNVKRAQVGSVGQSSQSGYTYSASAVSIQNSDPSNTGSPLADVEIVNVAVFR